MVLFVDVWCFSLESTKYGIFRRTAISKKISNTLPRGFCRKSAWHQRYLKVQQSKGWDNVFFCNGTIVKHHSIPYFTTLTLYLCVLILNIGGIVHSSRLSKSSKNVPSYFTPKAGLAPAWRWQTTFFFILNWCHSHCSKFDLIPDNMNEK